MDSFTQLEVWQKAHQLVLEVYKETKSFPNAERFRLTDQLCRAASYVPANIVEVLTARAIRDSIPLHSKRIHFSGRKEVIQRVRYYTAQGLFRQPVCLKLYEGMARLFLTGFFKGLLPEHRGLTTSREALRVQSFPRNMYQG
jgi:hypothetical protein